MTFWQPRYMRTTALIGAFGIGFWASTGILVFGVTVLALTFIVARRNDAVYKYRQQVIRDISEAVRQRFSTAEQCLRYTDAAGSIDFARLTKAVDVDFEWRWDAFRTVSYNTMVTRFWRPLPSFWADHAFHEVRK